MILIDGKKVAQNIKLDIAQQVVFSKGATRLPHLAAVIVGNDGASMTYVNNKVKACKLVGFDSTLVQLPENITEDKLLDTVITLNEDDNIDGYIVQLPLPKHIDEQKILLSINPNKDVDGFHPVNIGRMTLGLETYISATPYGILELIKAYDIETIGRQIVVIGRSNIVGRPISILLSQKAYPGNATVTLVHSQSKEIAALCLKADIIITALGIPNYLTADMIRSGAVVIDVGITRVKDSSRARGYRIVGDVDFDAVSKKTSYITPVPGGVGPMTIAMLLKNTLTAYQRYARQGH